MRIAIIGGYGVFGARLARLLIRDGHRLWIAGRSLEKAKALASELNAQSIVVDRSGDLSPLFACQPDVVIDAAGPFQSYGEERYALVERCLAEGVDYLDLSDDAAFTVGVSTFAEAARGAGRRLLSGASSVPGLSSSVVAALAHEMDRVDVIDMAILPGNRAPRGLSVIRSIAGRAGNSFPIWCGGRWDTARIWSASKRFDLGEGLVRRGYLIEVPDNQLFPAFFKARSVFFRAGMELGVLNTGLRALSIVRQVVPFALTPWMSRVIKWKADQLLRFGTDRGGMIVSVIGFRKGEMIRNMWQLRAEAGEGPFVPAIMCRALLRHWDQVPIGARPCLAELPLAEIEGAWSDLAIVTEQRSQPVSGVFQSALGRAWQSLPAEVKHTHNWSECMHLQGEARVTRGTTGLVRLIAAVFRFPKAGQGVPVTVTKTGSCEKEMWVRSFGGRRFRSVLKVASPPGHVIERFGPFSFELALPVENGEMGFDVMRGWALGMPLPRWSLPRSVSREYVENDRFHFDVGLYAPFTGDLIVRYQGWLRPAFTN